MGKARLLVGLAAAAAMLSLGAVGAAAPALAASSTPPPPCASGYFLIHNEANPSLAIAGTGVNSTVDLEAGNCWESIFLGTDGQGRNYYGYQNGYGHCLWQDGSNGIEEASAGCLTGHPNEEFVGVSDSGGWWTVESEANGTYWNTTVSGCAEGSGVYEAAANGGSCDRFSF